MLVGVNTRNMEISVGNDRIGVLVDYELDVNHEHLADCKIKMNIMSKENVDWIKGASPEYVSYRGTSSACLFYTSRCV